MPTPLPISKPSYLEPMWLFPPGIDLFCGRLTLYGNFQRIYRPSSHSIVLDSRY